MSDPRAYAEAARIHLRASLDARAVDEQRFHVRQALQYLHGIQHRLSEGERERETPRQS